MPRTAGQFVPLSGLRNKTGRRDTRDCQARRTVTPGTGYEMSANAVCLSGHTFRRSSTLAELSAATTRRVYPYLQLRNVNKTIAGWTAMHPRHRLDHILTAI
jgi:hypothetical protein